MYTKINEKDIIMKLDGIIDNVYFKQSIRSNTDNVSENDMKNFIEFIKKETPKKCKVKFISIVCML